MASAGHETTPQALEKKIEAEFLNATRRPEMIEAMAALAAAGIVLDTRVSVHGGAATAARFAFSRPHGDTVRVTVFATETDDDDGYDTPKTSIYAHAGTETRVNKYTALELKHLTHFNDEEWRALSANVHMPPPYNSAARVTELVVALMLRVFSRVGRMEHFVANTETYVGPDSELYYLGHGGSMRAHFRPYTFGAFLFE